MGEIVPLEDPLNYRRVMVRIKVLWEEGTTIVKDHARDEMAKDGLDDADLGNMIKLGFIRPGSHSNPSGGRWCYVIDGPTVDEGKAACVVEVDSRLKIITVYSLKKGKRREGGPVSRRVVDPE